MNGIELLPPENEVCEGYVFTGVCHSVHGGACVVAPEGGRAWLLLRGGVRGCSREREACVVAPGGACVVAPGGVRGCSGGACMVAQGDVCGCSRGGHVWLLQGGHVWLLWGGHVWLLWGACMVAPGGHAWLLPGGGACVVFSMRYGQ